MAWTLALPQSSPGSSVPSPPKEAHKLIRADMQQPGRGVHGHTAWGPLAPSPSPAQPRPDQMGTGHIVSLRSSRRAAPRRWGGPLADMQRGQAITHRTADGHMQTESRDSFIAPWEVYLRASLDLGCVMVGEG